MNNQSKPAEEYPEGSVSLATSAAEPEAHTCPICLESFDVIESKWGDLNTNWVKTYCCKQYMHFKCLDHWVHGNGVSQGKHSCPLCRKAMDLGSSEYNDLHDENSPYFYHHPELYVWEHDFWYYRGPFEEFVTVIPFGDQPRVNVIPEEARNGQTDAEFILNWNRRGGQPNGDIRTWTINPCQCSRPCYKGAYVLAEWANGEFDPQVLLNYWDYVLHEGKYVHKDCYERDNKHYELAKTLTDNFKLDTCFDDVNLDGNELPLSTFLNIRKPEGVRHFRKQCRHCNRNFLFLHKDKESNEVLSGNGWKRIGYKGIMVCKNCVEHYCYCTCCQLHVPEDFVFSPQCDTLCYPCGEGKRTVNSFVEERDGWRDGNKMYVPQSVHYTGIGGRERFFNKLNDFSPKEWKFYLFTETASAFHKEFVVLCKREESESKFIRAIVTLQRAYRDRKKAFVRKFSQNFTPGTYSAAMAEMTEESLQLWTPPGLKWRMLQCTMPECEGWTPGADDGFHSRTVMVLSERTKSAMEAAGWCILAGETACPCCYAKKRDLVRTFTHGFQEGYIDDDDLPAGLEWDELREIVEKEGYNTPHVDCDDCHTRNYGVTIENCPDFFWNNGWKFIDPLGKNKVLCPDCSENYVSCELCHDDGVLSDNIKYVRINKELCEVCEHCYETTRRDSAVRIQRHVRGFLIRQKALRDSAAVSIQRHVRGFLIRQKVLRYKDAVTIQRICRGFIARKRIKKLKEDIVEYVRKESGGTMVLKEGMHELRSLIRELHDILMWYYFIDSEGMPSILMLGRVAGRFLKPYYSPETKHWGCVRCFFCGSTELYTSSHGDGAASQFGWESISLPVGMRSICPTCIKAKFTSCKGCSKSYYPKDLIDGRCYLCLEAEAADASKRIQRAFRSYAKRKLCIAVRDAYVACCTFTDKFKPGLYRDEHCLSSFLKLMPSVEYLKKYDYVACSCDDRSCLTDWVYIFDETGPNYVPINRKGEWQCQKCLPTTTASKKRAAIDQSEGQTSKRVKKVSASMRDLVTKWLEEGGEDPRGKPPSNDCIYNYQTESWEYSSHFRDKRLRTRRRRGLNLKKGD